MLLKTKKQKNVEGVVSELGAKTTAYWKNMLETLPAHQIGVIKASGKLLSDDNIGQLCAEVSYLASNGFYLPIVFGAGPQYDMACKDLPGMVKINDIRVTPKEHVGRLKDIAIGLQEKILHTLHLAGVDSVAITPDSIAVQPHGQEMSPDGNTVDTGNVGDIVSINTKPIITAIKHGKVPVLSHLGMTGGEFYNVNATTVAKELMKFLQAKKLIVVGDSPILDAGGKTIPTIYSELEFKQLVANKVVQGGMVKNGMEAYNLLNYLGPGHSVQITSIKQDNGEVTSSGLLEELIGDGSGTKLILPHVVSSYPLDCVDQTRLAQLINDIFKEQGKSLTKQYFIELAKKDPTVYLDSMFHGGAITYPIPGCEYICKMFTSKDYEGLGIAMSIINTVLLQKNAIAWRTSNQSACNIEKYGKIVKHYSGGSEKGKDYTVFMIGVTSDAKRQVAQGVLAIPPTFERLKP